MHIRKYLYLALALSLACDDTDDCNDCINFVGINFEPPIKEAGTYSIDTQVDGHLGHCDVSLPFDLTKPMPDCGFWVNLSLTDPHVPETSALVGVHFADYAPAKIFVRVSQAGQVLGSQTFEPPYKKNIPGSPKGCFPSCRQVEETMQLQ